MSLEQNIKILRRSDVEAITGLARSTIYYKIERGEFPKPIKLGARASGWLEHEVTAWLEDKVSNSRQGHL